MKISAGVWIDHRKAVIVTLTGGLEQTLVIQPGVESQPGREDGVSLDVKHEALLVKADDIHQRQYTDHMNKYYAEVTTALGAAETLLIFGPGEAKGELKKRLEHDRFGGRVLALETEDKLTDRQIAAKVRDRFVHPHPVTDPA